MNDMMVLPNTDELELIPNPYGSASEAMTLAHQIREEEGLPMSEALSEAWDSVRGESNPEEASVEGSQFTLLALLGAGGYLVWCAIAKQKTGSWSWSPWNSMKALSQRTLAAKARAASNHQKSVSESPYFGTADNDEGVQVSVT